MILRVKTNKKYRKRNREYFYMYLEINKEMFLKIACLKLNTKKKLLIFGT